MSREIVSVLAETFWPVALGLQYMTRQSFEEGDVAGYSREKSCESETLRPVAIKSKFRTDTFLFPRSTSARKLRSIPTFSVIST